MEDERTVLDFRTHCTLAFVKPAAVDPDGRVVTQDAFLRLRNGKILSVFEWAEEDFFKEAEIGKTFVLTLYMDVGDRNITRLDGQNRRIGQPGNTTLIEGRVEKVERDTAERYRVWVDVGDCHVYFFTTHELKVGDFVRAEGRLEVREKREERTPSESRSDRRTS